MIKKTGPGQSFLLAGKAMSQVEQLSPMVRRITAPNPGMMTGNGTNTYLVGVEQVAVIDPGPAIDKHIDRILGACDKQLKWVIVTHTHPDHSPAAQRLIAETGATPLGCTMADDGHQDTRFQVECNVQHGELLQTSEFTLEAIFTPGHIGNHFCFLLQEQNLLFAGDHMFGGGTVAIIPPSGDMHDYLKSLALLLDYPIATIAPAHGGLIDNPEQAINDLIAHRLKRERKVIDALQGCDEISLEALVPSVYQDVDAKLHKVAAISLWAHLLKLQKDGIAEKTIEKHWAFGEERWKLKQ